MIDPTKHEQEAMAACMQPLGEYIESIGMMKRPAEYTEFEFQQLINVVVTAFTDKMRQLQDSGAPPF